jgi:hypothetical protein
VEYSNERETEWWKRTSRLSVIISAERNEHHHSSNATVQSLALYSQSQKHYIDNFTETTDSQNMPLQPWRWMKNATRSIGLWRWYINTTITILDIIHRPIFYLKHVSETGFCLLLSWAQSTELVPLSGLAMSIGPNWVGITWRRRQNPVSETCFK